MPGKISFGFDAGFECLGRLSRLSGHIRWGGAFRLWLAGSRLSAFSFQPLCLEPLKKVHDKLILVCPGKVIFAREPDGSVTAGFHAGPTEAALSEVQSIISDCLAPGPFGLDPF